MPTAAIVGASGYTGQETLDRVLAHPELELVALGSDSLAGQGASALDVRLNGSLPPVVPNEEALAVGADVTFLCLGHEEAAAFAPPADGVVVDLSGAHRLSDAGLYAEWYGFEHPRGGELGTWEYALPELWPAEGRLIANPGCYATAALLALAPLADAIVPGSVVVDGKSGMTGAGRSLKESSHAGFVLENVSAYRVGAHQHAPEIAQALGFPVALAPHLLPIRRGLLVTCYVAGARARPDRAARERVRSVAGGARPPRGRDPRAGARPAHGQRRGRGVQRPRDRPCDRRLRDRQPRQGRRGPGDPEREPALGLDATLGLRLGGVLV